MAHPLVYEINTRCWLRRLSDEAGRPVTLSTVPDRHFLEWQRLGFTHIWLMGVWTSGPRARAEALKNPELRRAYSAALPGWREEDVAGSPYAIAEYTVLPALGGEEALAAFRRNLNARGMGLVLDFVPNHLGLDHPWITGRPELFVQTAAEAPGTFLHQTTAGPRWIAHGKDPYFAPWTDTAQLDYRRPDTRQAMTELMLSVANRCDGLRCDMAMLLLKEVLARTWERFPPSNPVLEAEFWPDAIAAARRARPGLLFLAEAYWGLDARLQALGFDYTYDKLLYDRLVAAESAAVQQHLSGLPDGQLARGAHFLENHDEPRIASLLPPATHRPAALLVLGLPGLRLLHEGQLSGWRLHTPVQLLRRADEPPQAEVEQIYEQLLTTLKAASTGQGTSQRLRPRAAWPDNPTTQDMVLVQWQSQPPEFLLVVANLAPHRSQCYAPLTIPGLSAHNWLMKDLLGHERYERFGDDLHTQGLYLDLPEHGAQLFHFQPTR